MHSECACGGRGVETERDQRGVETERDHCQDTEPQVTSIFSYTDPLLKVSWVIDSRVVEFLFARERNSDWSGNVFDFQKF
jgi:hypothetical protein